MTKKRFIILFKIFILFVSLVAFIKIGLPRYRLLGRAIYNRDKPKKWFDLYWKSKELREEGKTDEALKLLKEAITYKGIDGKVYLMLAVIYMDKDEYELAEKHYKMALKHGMQNPANEYITLNNLGELYHDRYSDYDKAIKYFKKALAKRPKDNEDVVDPVTGLIESYVHNNQYDSAMKLLEKEKCGSRYCKWLQKAPRPMGYRSLKGVGVQTKIVYNDEMVKREYQMKSGEGFHGFIKTYNDKGIMTADQFYVDEKEEGIQRTFDDEGNLLYELSYQNGKLLDEKGALFTGVKEFIGKIPGSSSKTAYVDGLMHGTAQLFNKDGNLFMEMAFDKGEAGIVKMYDDAGTLQREANMLIKDGVAAKGYYEDGKVRSETIFKDGQLESIKHYDEEGNFTGDLMNPTIESAEIIRYGYIEDYKQREKVQEAKTDVPVCALSFAPIYDHATNVVPARLNVEFGFVFKVKGVPEHGFTRVVARYTHPPLTNPETGETVTVEDHGMMVMFGKQSHAGWIIAYDWEEVPGKYKIEVLYKDKILVEKEFTLE